MSKKKISFLALFLLSSILILIIQFILEEILIYF